jgi:hypothetical protein
MSFAGRFALLLKHSSPIFFGSSFATAATLPQRVGKVCDIVMRRQATVNVGLIFIPPRPIRELRDLTRRRERLNGAGSAEKNRVQKILEDANVKLGNVLADVFESKGC